MSAPPTAAAPRSSTAAAITLSALLGVIAVGSAIPQQLRALEAASDVNAMMLGLLLVLTAAALIVLLRLLIIWALVLTILAPPLRPLAGTARAILRRLAPRLARRVSAAALAGTIMGTAAFGAAASAEDRSALASSDHSANTQASAHLTVPLAPPHDEPPRDDGAVPEAAPEPSPQPGSPSAHDLPQLSWGSGEDGADMADDSVRADDAADEVTAHAQGTPDATSGTGAAPAGTTRTITVAPGDSLWSISAALVEDGTLAEMPPEQAWPHIYRANRSVIGADPDRIFPGTVITVPAGAAAGDASPTHPDSPEETR